MLQDEARRYTIPDSVQQWSVPVKGVKREKVFGNVICVYNSNLISGGGGGGGGQLSANIGPRQKHSIV